MSGWRLALRSLIAAGAGALLLAAPLPRAAAQAAGAARERAAIAAATLAYVSRHGAVPANKIQVTVRAVGGHYARAVVHPTDGSTDDAVVYLKKTGKTWARIAGPGTDWDQRELERLGIPRAVRGD